MKLPLLIVFGYVLILLVFVFPGRTNLEPGIENDFYYGYAPQALAMQQGHVFFDQFHPPLYGWICGTVSLVTTLNVFRAAILVSILCGGLSLLLSYQIGSHYGGAKIGLLAMLLVAATPMVYEYSWRASLHLPFALFCLAMAYFIIKQKGLWALLFFGLAVWTRYNAIPLAVMFLFLKERKSIYFSISLLVILSLGWWTSAFYGGFLKNSNVYNVAMGMYTGTHDDPWWQAHKTLFPTYWSVLIYDPVQVIKQFSWNVLTFAGKTPWLCAPIMLGLLAVKNLRSLRFDPIIATSLVLFLSMATVYWIDGFALGLCPIVAMLSAKTVMGWLA